MIHSIIIYKICKRGDVFNKIFLFSLTRWERNILLVIITQSSSPRFLFTKVFNFMCRIKMNFKYIFGNVFCSFLAVITRIRLAAEDMLILRICIMYWWLVVHVCVVVGRLVGYLFGIWVLPCWCVCVCFQCMRACPYACLHFRLVRLVDSVESEYKNHWFVFNCCTKCILNDFFLRFCVRSFVCMCASTSLHHRFAENRHWA